MIISEEGKTAWLYSNTISRINFLTLCWINNSHLNELRFVKPQICILIIYNFLVLVCYRSNKTNGRTTKTWLQKRVD